MKKILILFLVLLIFSTPAFAETILCASTTSTDNSGLFERILPLFKKKAGIDVHVIAVGTGAALEMGKRGDVDVIFVHAKDLELQGVKEGYFVNRHDVMYNDFVIVGPGRSDNNFAEIQRAVDVFVHIAHNKRTFVSRGDESGTHKKELSFWNSAGISPKGKKWYLEVGQGMAKTLRIANEKQAYTITDRGTWLSLRDRDLLDMKIVFEGDPVLLNQYGVMAVNPDKYPHVRIREALSFVNWLVSTEGQEAIGNFKDRKGNQLFTPNAN
jgi:tungstate transport system substrate-binding protein